MNSLRTLMIAAALALFVFSARADAKSEDFGELTMDEVSALIAGKSADIFDNNSKDEWKEGHVPTAKWVAFNDVKPSHLPKDHARKLVFYCHNRK